MNDTCSPPRTQHPTATHVLRVRGCGITAASIRSSNDITCCTFARSWSGSVAAIHRQPRQLSAAETTASRWPGHGYFGVPVAINIVAAPPHGPTPCKFQGLLEIPREIHAHARTPVTSYGRNYRQHHPRTSSCMQRRGFLPASGPIYRVGDLYAASSPSSLPRAPIESQALPGTKTEAWPDVSAFTGLIETDTSPPRTQLSFLGKTLLTHCSSGATACAPNGFTRTTNSLATCTLENGLLYTG